MGDRTSDELKEVPIKDDMVDRFCQKTFSLREKGLCTVEPYQQVFRKGYLDFHKDYQEFEIYDDDVWLCTFPKSGTRWMQELLWCLRNNLDFKKAKSIPTDFRVPYFELACVSPLSMHNDVHEKIKLEPRPRTIKSHFSYDMLPKQIHEKKTKVVCVIRNPRDVCVSFLNHLVLLENYTGDLPTITDLFLRDIGPAYTPYFKNILSYWNRRHEPNVFVVFYEEMQKDIVGVIKKLAEFLEIEITDESIKELAEHTSLKSMKANPMCNAKDTIEMVKKIQNNQRQGDFINKGKTGNWKDHFDEETIKRFDEWEKKWLQDSDLSFVYEL